MKNPIRIQSIEKPEVVVKLGNNSYYYRYDIKPAKIYKTTNEDSVEEIDGWDFIEVHIQGQPNYTDCVKSIIREYVSQEEEFDLINSANSYSLGVSENQDAKTEYVDYLNLLNQIKTDVKNYFN